MNIKKISAGLGMVALASGLGGGIVASAGAASTPQSHYDWYKVSGPIGSPATVKASVKLKETASLHNPNHGIMITQTIVRDSNKPTETFYYRATSPFAGGSSVDNAYAYNAWKTAPNQLRDIAPDNAHSNPSKGKYSYIFSIRSLYDFTGASYEADGEVVNGAHWAY